MESQIKQCKKNIRQIRRQKIMGAKLPDLETLWQAGINPKTGLPIKFGG